MLPTKFRIIRQLISEESTNQKQELPVETMFINGSGRNVHSLIVKKLITIHISN